MNSFLHPFNNCAQLKVLCVEDRGIPYLSGVATLLRDPFSAGSFPDLLTISNLKVQVENQGKSSYLMSKTDIENIKNFVNSKQSCLKYHTKNEFMSICTLTNFPIPEINGAAITRVSTTKGGVYMILGGRVHPGSLSWLCIRLHDTTRKCHIGTSHTGTSSPQLLYRSEIFVPARNPHRYCRFSF